MRLALERNPALRARVRDLEALGQRVPQATALPDPTLSLTPPTGDMIQTAGGEVDGSIGVSQPIPLPAKRASRGRIAEQAVRAALEELRSARLALVADVERAYFDFYLATASIDVTRENQGLLERLRDVAEAKYSAGTASQPDVLRAEVELYEVSNELISLEQQRSTAAARLNVLMDRDVLAELPAPAPRARSRAARGARRGPARARGRDNPALKARREAIRGDLEAVRLAKLARWPDFSLGALFTFIASHGLSPVANGDDVWSLTAGLTLPIWLERIRAGILERNAQVLASALRYRGARNDVLFAVHEGYVKVDAAYRSALLSRDGILPRARQTVEVSESGYRSGDVDFLTLIDNWRRLLDLTLSYHRSLATLERELAGLEQVVGGRVERSAPQHEERGIAMKEHDDDEPGREDPESEEARASETPQARRRPGERSAPQPGAAEGPAPALPVARALRGRGAGVDRPRVGRAAGAAAGERLERRRGLAGGARAGRRRSAAALLHLRHAPVGDPPEAREVPGLPHGARPAGPLQAHGRDRHRSRRDAEHRRARRAGRHRPLDPDGAHRRHGRLRRDLGARREPPRRRVDREAVGRLRWARASRRASRCSTCSRASCTRRRRST